MLEVLERIVNAAIKRAEALAFALSKIKGRLSEYAEKNKRGL